MTKEIGPLQYNIVHLVGARYLYRGYVILGVADGWSVLDPRHTGGNLEKLHPHRDPEDGWGKDMYQAMAVVNEIVEGDVRRKSK